MRLSRIKLAGFKSFVDPVDIKLLSARVGIIGPNGCGKSNTIDAVRWVMGESSAKHLRGESMDDVIFTGSSQRQPVSQASVELVFDNSDGSLGGEYAAYAEIALKREVTRDGQSRYLLNNTRCRRRDIRDIFLGTGLGPRSYAIIEQGMVSRLIEAKPEDLRVFLEEAAGISKYKERRRETENRISHTRDNLDRLDDLREEVEKQIVKLARQAETAERYQVLKADERRLRGELLVLRRQAFVSTLAEQDRSISRRETELEAVVTELRATETAIEQSRLQQEDASDRFNEVQANYYKIGSEVSRLEQRIEFTRENQRRQNQELADVERARDEARAHLEEDAARILEIDDSLANDQPAFDQLQSSQQHSAAVLVQAEREIAEWRGRQDDFNRRHGESSRTAQVERSRIDQLERNLAAADTRIARLDEERSTLDAADLQARVEALIVDEIEATEDEARLQRQVGTIGEKVQVLRDRQRQDGSELNDARVRAQSNLGRLASLEALQQAALEPAGDGGDAWLKRNAIDTRPRLAQTITAQAGWEQAVELVLGPYLEAVCVADEDLLARCIEDQPEATLALLRCGQSTLQAPGDSVSGEFLNSKVSGDAPLAELLHGVRVAGTVAEALVLRSSLGTGESVVTPDGFWLGTHWLRVARGEAGDSVLQREAEIVNLRDALEISSVQISEREVRVEEHAEQLRELEGRRETAQHACNDAVRNLSSVQSALQTHRQRLEQMAQRRLRLDEERADLDQTREQEREQREVSQAQRLEAVEQLDALDTEGTALRQEQESLQQGLKVAREQAGADRDAGQALAIRVESLRSTRTATEQNLQRMRARIGELDQRHALLSERMSQSEGDELDALDNSLTSCLDQRMQAESSLAGAREQLEVVQQRQREHEQARVRHDSRAQGMRDVLQNERMASQEVRVRLKTLDEQLAEHEYVIDEIEAALPIDAAVDAWAEELARTEKRVNRLGPINLAAIDEHAEQAERKTYLDSQHEDVSEALATLERAIAKIDRETRTRFRETFDSVNEKFTHFFPRLFGGGHACLELTGEDLLSTGVSVVAQPPGKRVSNIQLLSGGEKALTAVALVFAFFELNPSPFCMLDEVDAPLDDANVGRFCELVKEMSERVQFIFITHNKVTMEMADQLMGVTMNEPGVSRLVAVDVEEAVELAGA